MRYILLIFSFILGLYISSENSNDSRKQKVWQGEVTAVYKTKSRIRVTIYGIGKNLPESLSKEDIKKELLKAEDFELKRKDTDEKIARFTLKDLYVESFKNSGNGLDVDLILFGKFQTEDQKKFNQVSNNLYIAAYKLYPAYTDSSAFYSNQSTPPAKTIVHPVDKKEMVLVSGGLFLYGQGSNPSYDNYNPYYNSPEAENLLEIPSFYIDKYEVTNEEYNKYLNETNNPRPLHWIRGKYPEGKGNHPVINLSYREVELYTKWSGKRLPTEFEWEKAARGAGFIEQQQRDESFVYTTSTVLYPYGNKYDATLCNCAESKTNDTLSVYELPEKGASVYGVIGMCGNAPEWTSSWYNTYKDHEIKSKALGKIYKVIRGGSYIDSAKECTTIYRMYGGIPNLREDRRAGFRLVVDYKNP